MKSAVILGTLSSWPTQMAFYDAFSGSFSCTGRRLQESVNKSTAVWVKCAVTVWISHHPFILCMNVEHVLLTARPVALNEVRERRVFPRNLWNWPPSRLHHMHAEHTRFFFFSYPLGSFIKGIAPRLFASFARMRWEDWDQLHVCALRSWSQDVVSLA